MKFLSSILCALVSAYSWGAKVPETPKKEMTIKPATPQNNMATPNSALSINIPELRKIQAKLQEYKFLSLNFEQTIYKKLRKKTLKNQGEVYFKKPASFHWKFKEA